jgi:hypothetical protein
MHDRSFVWPLRFEIGNLHLRDSYGECPSRAGPSFYGQIIHSFRPTSPRPRPGFLPGPGET